MTAPALFLAHGAPSIALDDTPFTRAVTAFGAQWKPSAVVIVSAHWQTRGAARVNAGERPSVIYDFGGFAPELYSLRYDAPGAPELAREVAELTGAQVETGRGWDHGVWIPLRILLPEADVPVVELSLSHPSACNDLVAMGRALAPLRDRNILIAGSGGIVHNLGRVDLANQNGEPYPWAVEFDEWIASRLPDLTGWEDAPHAALAVPTPEHFDPVFFVIGASRPDDELVTIHTGIEYRSLSLRTFAFVPKESGVSVEG
jgi:4,5-DOPA dioxygenase extradiol